MTSRDISSDLFRRVVRDMNGYTPGEQPRTPGLVKLNTNENPYPPCPGALACLRRAGDVALNRYPDPLANAVRDAAADVLGYARDWILVGNGSDDILTIATRSFADQGAVVAYPEPSYSLYPVLTRIQGGAGRSIALTESFDLPPDIARQAAGAALLFLARPNAPTGNVFDLNRIRGLCDSFDGVVLIDEAYADFGQDHAAGLVRDCPNVIISRTLSKGYSLAGIRLGFACAQPPLIAGMMKVKDSYNVNALTQRIAVEALRDQAHLRTHAARIRQTRQRIAGALEKLGFRVAPSSANFLFVQPPLPAETYQEQLRQRNVLIRYFPAPSTRHWVRITIGTDAEMDVFLHHTREIAAVGPTA